MLMIPLRQKIEHRNLGQLPLGSCILVHTSHAKIKYLAYVAASGETSAISTYVALWNTFTAIHHHNRKATKQRKDTISVIVSQGFK